jgi:hypothetical protein
MLERLLEDSRRTDPRGLRAASERTTQRTRVGRLRAL